MEIPMKMILNPSPELRNSMKFHEIPGFGTSSRIIGSCVANHDVRAPHGRLALSLEAFPTWRGIQKNPDGGSSYGVCMC